MTVSVPLFGAISEIVMGDDWFAEDGVSVPLFGAISEIQVAFLFAQREV